MVADALIFIANLILSPAYALVWILWAFAKIIVLIFKPLWFIFFYLFALVKTFFAGPTMTYAAIWEPSGGVINFIHAFPLIQVLLTAIVFIIMTRITIAAFHHEK